MPGHRPKRHPVAGYELLIDGDVVAGSPDLEPGTTGRVILDLQELAEGEHLVSERYLFAPGEQGMLSSCVRSAELHIDRTALVSITSPAEGQSLCPDQGSVPIVTGAGEELWSEAFLIDGSTTGVTIDPATGEPAISVPALAPGSHLLEVSMVDLAGNAACGSVQFTSQGVAAVTGLEIQPPVFSPTNTMGRPTSTLVSFGSTADADWSAEIRDRFDDPVQRLSGNITAGETVSIGWDGRDFDGDLVEDGVYGLWIRLVSDCGAVYETPEPSARDHRGHLRPDGGRHQSVAVAQLGTAIELQALVTDPHFEYWEARLSRPPPLPGDPVVIASGDRQSTDPENVLVRWPVSDLADGILRPGRRGQRSAGNQTLTDEIPIPVQDLELIASFEAEPIYFSPNGDGTADTTDFRIRASSTGRPSASTEGWIVLLIENESFLPTPFITPQMGRISASAQNSGSRWRISSFTLEACESRAWGSGRPTTRPSSSIARHPVADFVARRTAPSPHFR